MAIVDNDARDREELVARIRAAASAEGARCSLRAYEGADDMFASFAPSALNLAFLDVLMPRRDGLALAARLRARNYTAPARAIARHMVSRVGRAYCG